VSESTSFEHRRVTSDGRPAAFARPAPLILCYHAISSTWPVSLATCERALESQLSFLKRRDYVGLTFLDAERRRVAGSLPGRSVVVTFDDGFLSTLRAKPILDEVGFPATLFVVTEFVDSGEPLAWDGIGAHVWTREQVKELQPLSWSDLDALVSAGWEVGSHTVRHRNLLALDADELERELRESRDVIRARVGGGETVAYPFGHADSRVAMAAAHAGYAAGCILDPVYRVDEQYRRARVGMSRLDVGLRLAAKLSPRVLAFRRSYLGRRLDSLRWSVSS
jgi:peptidoglycan/xylan/chitin deacetylase (PgdA/CDA1 family)